MAIAPITSTENATGKRSFACQRDRGRGTWWLRWSRAPGPCISQRWVAYVTGSMAMNPIASSTSPFTTSTVPVPSAASPCECGEVPIALVVDVVVWGTWCVAAGWYQARVPVAALRPGPVTRLRSFEDRGRCYARWLRVRAWKDHLPDAGTWFGGVSKSRLPPGDRRGSLERFAAESLRAERTHWTVGAITPVFAIW